MPTVRGCNLPDDLLYDVENNIWYRENADGTVTLGMTAVAAAMAGQLVAFTAEEGRPLGGRGQVVRHHRIRQMGRAGENRFRRRGGSRSTMRSPRTPSSPTPIPTAKAG